MKKDLSILGTMTVAVGAALALATLFDVGFSTSVPTVFWFSAALGIELGAVWLVQQLRRRMTAKMLLGIVICVSLVLGLGFGLVTSVVYLINYNRYIITSFPWYWGFSFAEYLVGPVVAVCSVAWAVLHLKEDRRHVRDLKLIWILVTAVTVLYVVGGIGYYICHDLKYPFNGFPWYVRVFEGIQKYALPLIAEAGLLWLLNRWEENLRSGGDFNLPPKPMPVAPPTPKLWKWGDFAIVAVPLGLIGALMLWQLDTMHIWYNVLTVVGNALAVCLLFVLAAWLAAHHYGTRQKLKPLLWINGGLILLTVAAGIIWAVWFNDKQISPLTGLRADTAIHLGIAYFAPFVLGEILSLILILRLKKRMGTDKARSTPTWWAVLAVLCIFLMPGMWCMLNDTEYRHEVECDITELTIDPSNGQLQLHVHPVVHIGSTTYHGRDRQEGQAYYIDVGAKWSPFLELKPFLYTHGVLAEEEEISQIYILKSPGVYELAAIKDPETGQWQIAEGLSLIGCDAPQRGEQGAKLPLRF